jgi:FhuF 2Fe-2S C-terminal domain
VTAVPATLITDPDWLRGQVGLAARRYGHAPPEVLGTIWWYSVSSVLVGPTLESLVRTGKPLDPALPAMTLDLLDDGTVTGAGSARLLDGDLGAALASAIEPAIATIEAVTGARAQGLRAIVTDSIANRLLWTGAGGRALALAEPLIESIGERMPRPRFTDINGTAVVRRASCCLIYRATAQPKCLSCPRQPPEERTRRLRAALG